MNLQEIRESWIKHCGRYDLVNDRTPGSFVDNGANYYIQAGLRLLDKMYGPRQMVMRYQKDMINQNRLLIKNLKRVDMIWAMNSEGYRWELVKTTLRNMLTWYDQIVTDLTAGDVNYWAPIPIALAPAQKALKSTDYTTDFTYDTEGLLFADQDDTTDAHWCYRGIYLGPPPDETTTIEVYGLFESVMTSNDDLSFWSVKEPDLLEDAANFSLENTYRNSEGMNEKLRMIQFKLDMLEQSELEEDLSPDELVMEG